jgi:hypothetical protein
MPDSNVTSDEEFGAGTLADSQIYAQEIREQRRSCRDYEDLRCLGATLRGQFETHISCRANPKQRH